MIFILDKFLEPIDFLSQYLRSYCFPHTSIKWSNFSQCGFSRVWEEKEKEEIESRVLPALAQLAITVRLAFLSLLIN